MAGPRARASRPPSGPPSVRPRPAVRIERGALVLGQARTQPLVSGAVHYWRLDPSAWRPALTALRDLGFPMVETYVPWGVHELEPGRFDFGEKDARKDLGAFLDLAHELGLTAFVRPGPHINSEMTYFGLPERIVYDRACQARSPEGNPVILYFPPLMFPVPSYASERFLQEASAWYDAAARVIAPRLFPKGPVVLLQVDNEASFYFRNGPYCQDYHEDAIASWHAFLRERHASLDALNAAHRSAYGAFEECAPPKRFTAQTADELVPHLDWAQFHEWLHTRALVRMRERMERAGLRGVPMVHNVALGEAGLPVSIPSIAQAVDLVGLDYYYARRDHVPVKRRSLYLAGTVETPYAPELGAGAPPYFLPLAQEDSLVTAMTALAYGVRGFNLYMAVDRDRWFGAPIDAQGTARLEAGAWKRLVHAVRDTRFFELERKAEVAIVWPREYLRLARATHLLGPVSSSALESVGAWPTDACREDAFGFAGPIQRLFWKMTARLAAALTRAGIPYVHVDGDADAARLEAYRLVVVPSYEVFSTALWKRLCTLAQEGATLVYGPTMPSLDADLRRAMFEVPRRGRRVLIDSKDDAERVVAELADALDLARPFRSLTPGVDTAMHEDASGPRVLFVLSPSSERVLAEVALPQPMSFSDVLTGERLDGELSLAVSMQPQSVRMLVATAGAAAPAMASRVRARRRA